ncbi:MAG: DUF2752 domain-containing protein [Verrucomicrobiota bacterium]
MHRQRACWLALGLIALGVAGFLLYQWGPFGQLWLPGCLFHQLTGLNCPGCGMTRAAHATLHGRPGEAFRFNPVGMILLPLACVGVGIELLGWVRGRPLPFRLNVGSSGAWAIVWIVIGFWILRNLPWWPFTLLSPP